MNINKRSKLNKEGCFNCIREGAENFQELMDVFSKSPCKKCPRLQAYFRYQNELKKLYRDIAKVKLEMFECAALNKEYGF